MRLMIASVLTGTLLLGLAGIPGSGQAQTAAPAAARPAAFAQCAGCHSTTPGKHLFGPSLAGISKRRSGTAAGYAYSPALAKAGIGWNAKTLDRWLTAPQKMVPGTRMPLSGVSNPADRRALVAYLLTL